jgi:DEAD/DEAH box helicase domain-containing protein
MAMGALVANRREGLHPDLLARTLSVSGPVRWSDPGPTGARGVGAQPADWYCGLLNSDYLAGFVVVPQTDVADKSFRRLRAWLRLMDECSAGGTPEWRRGWREFLRLCNVLQFLPEAAWMTSTGLQEGLYGSLLECDAVAERKPSNAAIELLLADVLNADARQIVIAADAATLVLPEIGFEITDSEGEIVAFAELAWPIQKVCVLTQMQEEFADAARAAGWRVLTVGEVIPASEKLLSILPKRTT